MKVLVVYASLYGNTKAIAEAVASACDSRSTVVPVSQASPHMLDGVTHLFLGSPTHGGRPMPEIKHFIASLPLELIPKVHCAAFATGIPTENQKRVMKWIIRIFGYAEQRISAMLKKRGATMIGHETFFVLGKEGPLKTGEIERAHRWAHQCMGDVQY